MQDDLFICKSCRKLLLWCVSNALWIAKNKNMLINVLCARLFTSWGFLTIANNAIWKGKNEMFKTNKIIMSLFKITLSFCPPNTLSWQEMSYNYLNFIFPCITHLLNYSNHAFSFSNLCILNRLWWIAGSPK